MKPALFLLAAVLFVGSAYADSPVRDHEIVAEDYFSINFATSSVLSPDASRLAYTELRWDEEEDKRNTDIWVLDVASREVTRLTFDPASDSSPQWSPDGSRIAFMSHRGGAPGQIYVRVVDASSSPPAFRTLFRRR